MASLSSDTPESCSMKCSLPWVFLGVSVLSLTCAACGRQVMISRSSSGTGSIARHEAGSPRKPKKISANTVSIPVLTKPCATVLRIPLSLKASKNW